MSMAWYQEVHLRDYLYVLRKRRVLIVAFFLTLVGAAVVFSYFEKRLFRATATILIEPQNPNVVDFKEVMSFDNSATDFYQTKYKMLASYTLVNAVIEDMRLDQDLYLMNMQKKGWRAVLRKFKYTPGWLSEFLVEPPLEDLFIRKMLRIKPLRNTRLVEVSVLHPDSKRSAELTNALVDVYIRRNLEDRFLIANQATGLIARQLVELKDKVGRAERKLQAYKEANNLVNIPSIREKDKFIQDAKLELMKIQAEEGKLAKRYLPAHPKRIHIRSQIEALQKEIDDAEHKNIDIGKVAIEYGELEREAESSRQIYKALLARLEETQSEAKSQASNVLVVDRAQPPPRPSYPRPFVNFLVAAFLGLVGGVVLAFFSDYLDGTVQIPDDVEKGLGLDLLGIVPEVPRDRKRPLNGELFFNPEKPTPASEAFRALRTALLFRFRRLPGCRTILITSPNPEEGKSTVALNLSFAFAQNRLRVLLIDADLRKPKIHRLFQAPASPGMTDVLEGTTEADKAIQRNVAGLGIDLLACGVHSQHPTEILGSRSMAQLWEYLKPQYDVIILDSPPYLPVADVSVLSEYVDAVVIVTRYHRTEKRQLKHVHARLGEMPNKISGVVINQVTVREKDYYYHQYYYYGYGESARPK